MNAAVVVGRALLDHLAGRDPGPPALPALAELVESAAGGVPPADDAVLAHAWWGALPGLVGGAKEADGVVVPLADGTTLALEQAERLLLQKEERRAYPPLRTPLERAVARALAPDARRRALQAALPTALASVVDVVAADADVAPLRAFLAATATEAEACRALLASVGGAPLDGPPDREAALRRGLDLPAPSLFNADVVTAAVRLALSSTNPVRHAARTSAPHAFAGHVVDDGTTPRLFVAPCASAGRHLALAAGAGVVVAAALHAAAHGPGLGFALVDEATQRALDRPRDDARRAFRVTVATALLRARALAAVATSVARPFVGRDADEERREVTRSAVRGALLGDPGAAFVDALLAPPWPDGQTLVAPAVAAVVVARRAVRAARSWQLLRDSLDEGFVARRGALRALAELPAAVDDDAGTADAQAWRAVLGELL